MVEFDPFVLPEFMGACLSRTPIRDPIADGTDVAMHSVVLVGGPCGGKTSVIPALRVRL
jgi:hypothetical protein